MLQTLVNLDRAERIVDQLQAVMRAGMHNYGTLGVRRTKTSLTISKSSILQQKGTVLKKILLTCLR
jgi:hypothetical protein